MKLTLEEIWKMADLLEETQKIKVGAKKLVQEEQPQTQERVLKLPQLQISENWGKLDTVERNELIRIVDSATRGGSNPFERLKMIRNQMEQIASGADVKNPRRIISQIILLETLNRMFKSFQPSPAGFINEAFLSVIYGSVQKTAIKGNAEGDIGDITDGGIPVSLKTVSYGEKGEGPIIKGSVANLISSINLNDSVYFDVYLKNSSGAKTAVGKMEVYRFVVNAENINQFLQLSPGTIPTDAQTGKLQLPDNLIKEGFVGLKEQPETEEPNVLDIESGLSEEAASILRDGITKLQGNKTPSHKEMGILAFQVLEANNFKLPKSGQFREFVNNLNPKSLFYIIEPLKQLPRSPKVLELIKYFSGEQISKEKPTSKALESEFRIPYGHWMKFVDNYLQEKIVIEFSDEKIKTIIENAVKSLDASITEIFNNLADFTSSLQNYLTSTQEGRGEEGERAVKLAEKLTPSTEKVVKDTAIDQD
jgi:hypothetical protein